MQKMIKEKDRGRLYGDNLGALGFISECILHKEELHFFLDRQFSFPVFVSTYTTHDLHAERMGSDLIQ